MPHLASASGSETLRVIPSIHLVGRESSQPSSISCPPMKDPCSWCLALWGWWSAAPHPCHSICLSRPRIESRRDGCLSLTERCSTYRAAMVHLRNVTRYQSISPISHQREWMGISRRVALRCFASRSNSNPPRVFAFHTGGALSQRVSVVPGVCRLLKMDRVPSLSSIFDSVGFFVLLLPTPACSLISHTSHKVHQPEITAQPHRRILHLGPKPP